MKLPAHRIADPWPSLRARLREAVGQTTFDVWLSPLFPISWDGSVLELGAPEETRAWVSRRYHKLLGDCAREVLGPESTVRLAVSTQAQPHDNPAHSIKARWRDAPPEPPLRACPRELRLNPRYSFDQFVIGEGNRFAHAAALAVSELPGQAYNPLFLYAPPGLGKTHLLHAIGNYVTAFGGGSLVRYATVEAFTNHFLQALNSRSIESFKNVYRDADVLLIDDVQFLASKAKTEEEFFHTFNAVYENGRQLVITSDRVPSELGGIEQRLRERFGAGLVAEIAPPDHAMRVAILRKRAALDGITIDDPDVFDLIASRVTDNIRALEGALIRVVAYHSLTSRLLDGALAETVLDSIYPPPSVGSSVCVEDIQTVVADHIRITLGEMLSAGRAARITWPRQVAVYLTRELTTLSLPAIGQAYARNHATVLHACRRVEERLVQEPSAREDVQSLRLQLSRQQNDRRD